MAKKTRAQLLDHLAEQRGFLDASAAAYDAGFESEAKRLAGVLRVLLLDTKGGMTSLLGQLKVKTDLDYLDTARPIHPLNRADTWGLTLQQSGGPKNEGRYVPRLVVGSSPAPPALKTFPAWWERPVIKLINPAQQWSRKDLVQMLYNREGGGHVDPALDERYEHIAKANGLGWAHIGDDGIPRPFEGDVFAASVRQITHELTETLQRQSDRLV